MATYPPVNLNRISPIFNPQFYGVIEGGNFLTLSLADSRYLKLTGGNINGQLTINNELSTQKLILTNDGVENVPAIKFNSNFNDGFYYSNVSNSFVYSHNSISTLILGNETKILNQLQITDGNLSNLAIAFSNETKTGIYRGSNNQLDFAINGNNPLSLRNNDTYILGDIHIPFNSGNGKVLTSNGSGRGRWENLPSLSGTFGLDNGTVASPSLFFLNDTNLGLYRIGENHLGISCGGTLAQSINLEGTYFRGGTVSLPSISFIGDTNTGLYNSSADEVSISCGGTKKMDIGLNGTRLYRDATKYLSIQTDLSANTILENFGGGIIQLKNGVSVFNVSTATVSTNRTIFTSQGITLGNGVNGTQFLKIDSERPWEIRAGFSGSGAATSLDLLSTNGGKDLNILNDSGTSGASVRAIRMNATSGEINCYTGVKEKIRISPSEGIYHFDIDLTQYMRMRCIGSSGYLEIPNAGNIYIGHAGTVQLIYNAVSTWPSTTGIMDLGQTSRRFKTIFLINNPNVGSSEKTKKDINICCGLQFINKLQPKTYRYIFDNNNDPLRYGLMAEELKQVLLENNMTFRGLTENTDEEGNIDYGIAYAEFVAPLIRSVQELIIENNNLKNELENQKQELQNQKQELEELKLKVDNFLSI